MPAHPTIQKLLNSIDAGIIEFSGSMGSFDLELYHQIETMVKDMDVKDGAIVNNAKNLSMIGKAKSKIEQIVRSDKFNKKISGLFSSLNIITDIQHDYFAEMFEDFEPHDKLKELQHQTISDTIDSLKGADMKGPVIDKAQEILRTNITKGKSYSGMMNEVRDYLIVNDGPMVSHAKQITTDTLNTYAGTYNKMIAADLGLVWYMYVGAIIETSRAFCKACIAKEFIHESEFSQVIQGKFPEFKEMNGEINKKTGLPEGLKPGTNKYNFEELRGGWECSHLVVPVSAAIVPKFLRAKFPD